jgi:hypothetical protein
MSDDRLQSLLGGYRRRFRLASMAFALLLAAGGAGLVLGGSLLASLAPTTTRVAALVAFVAVLVAAGLTAWRRWTLPQVARTVEYRVPLDNLLVTAEEVSAGRIPLRSVALRDELFASAESRLEGQAPAAVQPLAGVFALAAAALVALSALIAAAPQVAHLPEATLTGAASGVTAPLAPGDIRFVISPPSYTRQEATAVINPPHVVALEGSAIRIEVRTERQVTLHELDGRDTQFVSSDGLAVLTLPAAESRPLLIRQQGAGEAGDRLVHLRVEPDRRAVVTIIDPAKDLIFAEGRGEVPVHIQATDDVAIESLVLRFTHVSGSGETFTFEEGEWPIEIVRESRSAWRARGVFSLDALKLQDGDSIVYRAVARDARPGSDPSVSESYLIEVGRLAGVASQGFAVDEEQDRHAISQQMVIAKTEKLHAARGSMSESAFLEQSQLLAVEQRMVQSEFVFMTGGHVHDEVEEAEQSHEIAEGRLENSATVEMMNAIREMSRAEARLNAGDTGGALPRERAALAALQRAFDRRRYFLRTLPERSRIDVTRRLSGELETARSSTMPEVASSADPVVQDARAILAELNDLDAGSAHAVLASRLLALDPSSEALQASALRLSAAGDPESVRAASADAQSAVVGVLRERLGRQIRMPLERDPVRGRLHQELRRVRP